jgi:glycosyltransferase 2 family protein
MLRRRPIDSGPQAPPSDGRNARRRGWHRSAALLPPMLVSGAGIYFALHGTDLYGVRLALASTDYSKLVFALALLAAASVIRATRWQVLFAPATRPPFGPTLEVSLVGQFFNCVLPVRAGELIRIFALHARAGTSRPETAATLVVERAFDVLALLGMLFLALPWLPTIPWLRTAAVLAAALTVALVVFTFLLARWKAQPLRIGLRPFAKLPLLSSERVEKAADSLARGLVALRSTRLGLVAFGLTIVSWLVLAGSFWLAAAAVVPRLPVQAGILIAAAIGLALILPSGPAALGVFEAGVVSALAAYDVPDSPALSAALVVHAVNLFPYLAVGGVLLVGWRSVDRSPGSGSADAETPGAGVVGPVKRRRANLPLAGTDRDDLPVEHS